jgi:hypothetical protein
VALLNRLFFIAVLLVVETSLQGRELSDTLSALPRIAPGTVLGTIKVGSRTYNDVRIKSYDSRSLIFTHSEGLGSARLRDLTPDLQDLLGYNPGLSDAISPAAGAAAKPVQAPTLTPLPQPIETSAATGTTTPSTFDALVTKFGTMPELRARQSLQGEFVRLSLTAKSQGRRLSCAIFAVVSALEFQNAKATGIPQKLSEDYLIWATRRITGHMDAAPSRQTDPRVSTSSVQRQETPPTDLGYSLSEVVSGLRAFGIATQAEMPDHYSSGKIESPFPENAVVSSARTRRLVNILPVPGRQNPTVLSNIVQALNHGYPVPIGLRWPHDRSIRDGVLLDQPPKPDSFHAVTLVGYECPSGRIEESVFIFKNSFGTGWGIEGYGRAAWRYLEQNLIDAIVLDVGAGGQQQASPKP